MRVDALSALRNECNALSVVLNEASSQDYRRTTNCPPWDLRELVVHIAASIQTGDAAFHTAEPDMPVHSAADYYRRPERDTTSYRQNNVDHTRQLARTVLATATAAEYFAVTASRTISALDEHDVDRVVDIQGRGAMRLSDWIVTRVVSIAAHGLDVAITLERPPWTTAAARRAIVPVFVDLLGTPPPDSLRWDGQTFLATATGRRELTSGERDLLGSGAQRFPLLS